MNFDKTSPKNATRNS